MSEPVAIVKLTKLGKSYGQGETRVSALRGIAGLIREHCYTFHVLGQLTHETSDFGARFRTANLVHMLGKMPKRDKRVRLPAAE